MEKFSLTIILILIISSCKPCEKLARKCPPVIKDSISYTETVTENPNYTIPDSAYWDLQFECDSNLNVILRQFNEANTGLRTETVFIYKEDETKKKLLLVSLKVSSDSILSLNTTIEKKTIENRTIIIENQDLKKENEKLRKECNKYKSRPMFIWSFVILIVLIILSVVVIYFKIKNKTLKSLLNR